jgi:MFS family permease
MTIVLLAVFILVVDTTMMNVASNNLVVDLNTTVSVIQPIIAIYALIMASLFLMGARMRDVFGRRTR